MNVNEKQLEEALSTPSPSLIRMMQRLEGDLLILGADLKTGLPLALASIKAVRQAGITKRVLGAGEFDNPSERARLEGYGIETFEFNPLEGHALNRLPDVKNILFIADREAAPDGISGKGWALNTVAPANVISRFWESRVVVFSSASVYQPVPASSGGSLETDSLHPEGEAAQAVLAGEKIVEYYSRANQTPTAILRLGHMIDLRFGILRKIGDLVYGGFPVDISLGYFNPIWLGDAVNQALLSLEHCAWPPRILNIAGLEKMSVRETAEAFAGHFSLDVNLTGKEAPLSPLCNAGLSSKIIAKPVISGSQMIMWTAEWIKSGGPALEAPS